MKVTIALLFVVVAVVFAAPLDENNKEIQVLSSFEAEPIEVDADFVNELVRDKRQYGGN